MINVTIDSKGYKNKPNKDEIGRISQRLGRCGSETIADIHGFAYMVSEEGYTWCPAVFSGKRAKSCFVSAQLLALDFDDGASLNDILDRSRMYMLPILFAYETFSSVDMSKFRIVFMLGRPITDVGTYELTVAMLMAIFPECDSACRDASRMFFGGKRLIYYAPSELALTLNNLKMNFEKYMRDRYGATHYKVYMERFFRNQKACKISPFTGYNKTTNGENLHKNHKNYRKDTLDKLYTNCRLYREFTNDSEWLYYNELFGIATNLIHIETGKKLFLDRIENSKYDTYKKDWSFYLKYMTDNGYLPQRCDNFCPYCDECVHGSNMLSLAKVKRKEIIRVSQPAYQPIEYVQQDLINAFNRAMSAYDRKLYVIKAQTAIGKTHLYLEHLKHSEKPCIIAVPTNILKHEIAKECKYADIPVIETPSIDEFEAGLDPGIFDHIKYLQTAGMYKMIMPYVMSKIAEEPLLKHCADQLREVRSFKGHIITTHHRILYDTGAWSDKYQIIIDEDILKTMVTNQISVNISDIEYLMSRRISNDVRDKLYEIVEMAENNSYFDSVPLGYDFEPDDKIYVGFNANALLNAKKLYSDGMHIVFYATPELPKHTKYTILSATADEFIYKEYFGEKNVDFYTCAVAPYKGRLIQFFDHSYSRRYIGKNTDIYGCIRKLVGSDIITFKKYDEYASALHFGNSAGSNSMKGKDIAVVGTPHMAEFLYKLLYYQMGYDIGDDELRYREVMHNGFKFWFYTYENEVLRRIQFWMIESELEQSVGRARLLRCDCTVYLFSDFPLMQSELRSGGVEMLADGDAESDDKDGGYMSA